MLLSTLRDFSGPLSQALGADVVQRPLLRYARLLLELLVTFGLVRVSPCSDVPLVWSWVSCLRSLLRFKVIRMSLFVFCVCAALFLTTIRMASSRGRPHTLATVSLHSSACCIDVHITLRYGVSFQSCWPVAAHQWRVGLCPSTMELRGCQQRMSAPLCCCWSIELLLIVFSVMTPIQICEQRVDDVRISSHPADAVPIRVFP